MTKDADLGSIKKQLGQISMLRNRVDLIKYDAWHKVTELTLRRIFGSEADEVKEFKDLDGRSNVIFPDDDPRSVAIKSRAYSQDLDSAEGLLRGIIEYLGLDGSNSTQNPAQVGTLEALHPEIQKKCSPLYLSNNYVEAAEKGFKVVRDRLREITGFESGQEAFGKGNLYINGASAKHVDEDFQQACQFLAMAIDRFRNEKVHTSDGNIEDPRRAYEYLALSSLAMNLLEDAKVVEKPKQQKKPKEPKQQSELQPGPGEKKVQLDDFQILALRLYANMTDGKDLLVGAHLGGHTIHPLGSMKKQELMTELNNADTDEFIASLEELETWGVVTSRYNSRGDPIYKLAKPGYQIIKEHPELKE